MKRLKNSSSNDITLYQLPIIARISYIASAVGLSALPVFGLLFFDVAHEREEFIMALTLFFFFCLYDVLIYFLVFKTYLKLDLNSNNFVIREFPGFHKHLIKIDHMKEIKIDNDDRLHVFSIIITSQGGTERIDSWSMGHMGFHLMFNNNKRQIKRLSSFCYQVNKYLNKRM